MADNTYSRLSRRRFLALAGGTAASAWSLAAAARLHAQPSPPNALPDQPNLLFIVTDQERSPQHWPQDWDYALNLPSRQRLLDHGISFQRHFCNATMCSPSRASLFTGLYPEQHGLKMTLTYNGKLSNTETPLSPNLQNMAQMLAAAGYHVAWKGKWHMSKHADGGPADADDLLAFGATEWTPTTAGEAQDPVDYGDGCAANDPDIADQAVAFLESYTGSAPFALFVMLVNPHDVIAYPGAFDDESCGADQYSNTANFSLGILLPPTVNEDLAAKPTVQAQSRDLYASFLGPLLTDQRKLNYVNFYADLHRRIDQQIGRVLAALDAHSLVNHTVILRTADHGEMGLSHGGLRQKMFNAYDETLRVPLIISNPVLFPAPVVSNALASLVDLMPTVASLVHLPNPDAFHFSGFDLTPLFTDPTASVQDAVLFTFDDERAGTATELPFVQQPSHIRCIREQNWKYARYFDPADQAPPQYELYDLAADPLEQVNLAGNSTYAAAETRLRDRLTQLESERLTPFSQLYLPSLTK